MTRHRTPAGPHTDGRRHAAPWLVVVALWCLAVPGALAQSTPQDTTRTREVEILHADSLAGEVVGGERVQRLVGAVALRQDSTLLWADRVVRFLDRDEIRFSGNVRIVDQSDTLWAPTVVYDRRTKTGVATGGVRLSDGDVVVTAPAGRYDTEAKRAVFEEGVTLVDSATVLKSERGEYWTEEKRAEFAGSVSLDESHTHLEADSVTYFRETEVSIARGNVFIERLGDAEEADDEATSAADSTTRTLLFGAYAYNDNRAGFSRIEGRPLLVQLRRDTTVAGSPPPDSTNAARRRDAPGDSLFTDVFTPPLPGTEPVAEEKIDTLLVRAVVLEVTRVDSLRRLVAVDSVRIWQRELAAIADSLVFDRIAVEDEETQEEARLFGAPVAWFDQSQVTGDSLRVKGRGGAVDTLFVRGNSFVAQRDTVLERIHQLKGQHLTALFEDDSLRTLTIGPNAEAIHFRTGDGDRPDGAVRTSADEMTFEFEGGEVRRIRAVSGVEGTYYPEGQMPQPLQLDGYRWLPEARPTREGLLEDVRLPDPAVRPGSEHAGSPEPPDLPDTTPAATLRR